MSSLVAFNPATRKYDPPTPGRAYRVKTHDESACLDGDCGGIIDRGVLIYVTSRYLYRDHLLGDLWSHTFRLGHELIRFREDIYSLSLAVAETSA